MFGPYQLQLLYFACRRYVSYLHHVTDGAWAHGSSANEGSYGGGAKPYYKVRGVFALTISPDELVSAASAGGDRNRNSVGSSSCSYDGSIIANQQVAVNGLRVQLTTYG